MTPEKLNMFSDLRLSDMFFSTELSQRILCQSGQAFIVQSFTTELSVLAKNVVNFVKLKK